MQVFYDFSCTCQKKVVTLQGENELSENKKRKK